MQTVSKETQGMVIFSLESTLRKLIKAFESVVKKGGNTYLITKRRDAIQIGLDSLIDSWNTGACTYDRDTIVSAIAVLKKILPSIEKQLMKAKKGSAQKTVNQRRYYALVLAINSLEDRL